jgi:hypothetical protein
MKVLLLLHLDMDVGELIEDVTGQLPVSIKIQHMLPILD